jgi:hypothetical protein
MLAPSYFAKVAAVNRDRTFWLDQTSQIDHRTFLSLVGFIDWLDDFPTSRRAYQDKNVKT